MDPDVLCPICLNLFFRPVQLPCHHRFCKECILEAVEKNKYQCPICRHRLSNWLRKVKDVDSIICVELENEIRRTFPSYYNAKELGESPMLTKNESNNISGFAKCQNQVCAPGEIYKEYLVEAEKQAYLRTLEDKKNEEASLALIAQLLAEESMAVLDEFATNPSPACTPTKHHSEACCSKVVHPKTEASPQNHTSSGNLKSSKKHASSLPRPRRTLLEYAVDKRIASNQTANKDCGSCDEEFARKLQEEYMKIASSPVRKTLKNAKRKR